MGEEFGKLNISRENNIQIRNYRVFDFTEFYHRPKPYCYKIESICMLKGIVGLRILLNSKLVLGNRKVFSILLFLSSFCILLLGVTP